MTVLRLASSGTRDLGELMSGQRKPVGTARMTIGLAAAATAALASSGAQAVAPATPSTAAPDRRLETVFDRPLGDPTAFDDRIFFRARARGYGWELWRSNGTRRGTSLLKDLRPGRAGSYPSDFIAARDTLYFFATGGRSRTDLWKTDGTRSGTIRVKRGVGVDTYDVDAAAAGNKLFFFAVDETHGRALWRSDGTASGTVVVKDHIAPGWQHHNGAPDEMEAVGGTMFFTADDRTHGRELWKSNGRVRGTKLVKDIYPGRRANGTYDGPAGLTAVGSSLLFSADDGTHGRVLWRSDGSSSGTTLLKDVAFPRWTSPVAVGDTLFFAGEDPDHGNELWKSDGTPGGTVMVANIRADDPYRYSGYPGSLMAAESRVYFSASSDGRASELWVSDGMAAETLALTDLHPEGCTAPEYCDDALTLQTVGDSVYFEVRSDSEEAAGSELWYSDGTVDGTELVEAFHPGPQSDPPIDEVLQIRGTLFLEVTDADDGERLIKVVDN